MARLTSAAALMITITIIISKGGGFYGISGRARVVGPRLVRFSRIWAGELWMLGCTGLMS